MQWAAGAAAAPQRKQQPKQCGEHTSVFARDGMQCLMFALSRAQHAAASRAARHSNAHNNARSHTRLIDTRALPPAPAPSSTQGRRQAGCRSQAPLAAPPPPRQHTSHTVSVKRSNKTRVTAHAQCWGQMWSQRRPPPHPPPRCCEFEINPTSRRCCSCPRPSPHRPACRQRTHPGAAATMPSTRVWR